MKIKKDDKVVIKCQGLTIKGTVLSANNYGDDGGWYIEIIDSYGGYRYWKQDMDGGKLLEHVAK